MSSADRPVLLQFYIKFRLLMSKNIKLHYYLVLVYNYYITITDIIWLIVFFSSILCLTNTALYSLWISIIYILYEYNKNNVPYGSALPNINYSGTHLYAGLEVIVLGKINWCHFQQIDQNCSWHNNKPIVYVMFVVKKYSYIYVVYMV